ncbi:diacylglycerol kinase [Thermoanaerobacteraceae bacterium SP2]|nr:diacylglycerol kinase [Thermoanaerobacteraceae bacterium SP2]
MKKSRTLLESFKYAVSGTIYSFKTQRNIRIHFLTAITVLLVSPFFNFGAIELLIIFFTIALVIITEMINTAIETTVDLVTEKYHPLAEIAKNVAAGAVLISALNAVVVGYLIFYKRLYYFVRVFLFRVRNAPQYIFFLGLIIGIIYIILFKIKSKEE